MLLGVMPRLGDVDAGGDEGAGLEEGTGALGLGEGGLEEGNALLLSPGLRFTEWHLAPAGLDRGVSAGVQKQRDYLGVFLVCGPLQSRQTARILYIEVKWKGTSALL